MAVNTKDLNKKSVKWFYFSLWIFIFVLFLTIWIYIYNIFFLQKKIDNLNTEKEELLTKISDIRSDDRVVLYSLIKQNKDYLDKKFYLSKIDVFINTLKEIWNKYYIDFNSFSYSNWKISTNALVLSDNIKKSYDKIYDMMVFLKSSEEHIFELDFVNSFLWNDDITFNVNFNLK